MLTNVKGKVQNTDVPVSKPLLPLFEAITNSLQSIEDAGRSPGRIDVTILRERQKQLSDDDRAFAEIVGFRVTDDGIGFTDTNYQAFNESETTFKADRGGKGIGRFTWLVAFSDVSISSAYNESGKNLLRVFRFVPVNDGIADASVVPTTNGHVATTIELRGFRAAYQKQCPKKPETIASYIIEHFLEFFIGPRCPDIFLHDEAGGDPLDLRQVFEHEMVSKSQPEGILVGETEFTILHVRLNSTHIKDHALHFCANHRVVYSEKLGRQIPNLTARLRDDKEQEFVYAGYVESDYLDTHASSDRTAFSITEDDSELLSSEITWTAIRKGVHEACRVFLTPFTEPVRIRKAERIQEFVRNQAPMYRPILDLIPDEANSISPDASDGEMDLHLYRGLQRIELSLKEEGQKLLNTTSGEEENVDEYRDKMKEYFEKVTKIKAADLARYVCQRKAILEFLKKQLSIADDGKYPKEDRVHNIIFPMGKTSDEVRLDEHNLWLLDERLVYHFFLASDKQLRVLVPLTNSDHSEPDIIVFDKACAFVGSEEHPFSSITIIEFKRPMRKGYTENTNPFVQVREYIDEIRAGKARTPDGRDIPILAGMPFYCFIVCDIDSTIEKQAYDFELTKTPDGQGFFGFKRQYDAYFEVISYSKMAMDAQKRNAVFFDKLGLPSRVG